MVPTTIHLCGKRQQHESHDPTFAFRSFAIGLKALNHAQGKHSSQLTGTVLAALSKAFEQSVEFAAMDA